MGDGIQAMKAGIMEIANVLAVNKADLPGADILVSQLTALLSLSSGADWVPPIVKVVATEGEGIHELVDACDKHYAYLVESGKIAESEANRARRQIVALARKHLLAQVTEHSGGQDRLDDLVAAVAKRQLDPHSAVDQWISG